MAPPLPSFKKLWDAFPTHDKYRTMKDLFTWLGGQAEKNIHQKGFGPNGNTCASRLSVAFNLGGAPIDENVAARARARHLRSADKALVLYDVAGFRRYLREMWGEPIVDKTSPFDDAFKGKQGLIAFSVNWEGATGHIALWNGRTYREPHFDNYASYVHPQDPNIKTRRSELWELPA